MSAEEIDLRRRIVSMVDSLEGDHARSHQLFQYVWTLICVRRGLMRVVREIDGGGVKHLVIEELKTGHRRIVSRPPELDGEMEGLAVQALSRILARSASNR